MSKDEFMKSLEYLLSDIPDEDKADAIGYYRDYLEEAGPDKEEQVIRDFGSPERIASIIRSEISGHLSDGGEFTENGYEDERFKDPNYQMAKRYDLPDVREEESRGEQRTEEVYGEKKRDQSNRTVKLILWAILLIAASPLILGIGGLGAITLALLVSGFAVIIAGFVSVAVHPLGGFLVLGIGVALLGLGLLGLAVCAAFYGKFLPNLFRGVVNAIQTLLNRRRSRL